MPDWVYRIGGTGATLSQDEQDNNILCIYDALNRYGWTKVAIAGACGCFQQESSYNPGIYETSHGGNLNNLPYFPGGMGMPQLTDYPAYTAQYPNPLPWSAEKENKNWYDGDFQCWLLTQADNADYTSMGYGQGPRWGWQMSNSYPSISFNDYIHFNGTVDDAVKYWFYCFEWHAAGIPDWVNYDERVRQGKHALEIMGGYAPGGTIDTKKLITILAKRRGERSGRIRRTILL